MNLRGLPEHHPSGQKAPPIGRYHGTMVALLSYGLLSKRPCQRTSLRPASSPPSALTCSVTHTLADCGHGGTRKSNTSRTLQTWSVNPVWPKYPNALLSHRLRLYHDARFILNFMAHMGCQGRHWPSLS
jgi:hypothetical protein